MIAMQYKIVLPNDYDMDIIRTRVSLNGSKTDGFSGLLFKSYLISDCVHKKQYAPLYIWESQAGMNSFIFEGYYDNILKSFGWQQIHIAIPLTIDISNNFSSSKCVIEIEHELKNSNKMQHPHFTFPEEKCFGKVLVYNPDTWKWAEFYFFDTIPCHMECVGNLYQVLHTSM